ncbi:hypothetical protein T492DRAFT_992010 [Pavlovales sp. CCMP2436]|nr:hypothetical protein T492DRAFT_992010 [Pavlovales sp. CCMP2436]
MCVCACVCVLHRFGYTVWVWLLLGADLGLERHEIYAFFCLFPLFLFICVYVCMRLLYRSV